MSCQNGIARRKKLLAGLVILLSITILLNITVLVVLIVRHGNFGEKPAPASDELNVESSRERIHFTVDYEAFLDAKEFKLPFSDGVFVGLRLAKAYPLDLSVNFRFDVLLNIKEEKHRGEFIVSAIPRIVNNQIILGEWSLVSFDIENLSADQVQAYNDTGDAVFALFKHQMRTNILPLNCNASKILQLTSAEMILQ